jgi:6-phosphogluconolactonase
MKEVRVFPIAEAMSRRAAEEIVRLAEEAAGASGRFTVALSGGSTPRATYALMAEDPSLRERMPWSRTHFFWGDERLVPPDHPESNYRMANEAMLSKVPVPPENVHRIVGEHQDATQAADEYERTLIEFFKLSRGEFPFFDLALLGLGPDGHVASLFPGTVALRERQRLVVANWVEQLDAERITMTPPVFSHAACVIFLVSGAEKAAALKAVLEPGTDSKRLPAQRIRPQRGRLIWLADGAAARLLEERGESPT